MSSMKLGGVAVPVMADPHGRSSLCRTIGCAPQVTLTATLNLNTTNSDVLQGLSPNGSIVASGAGAYILTLPSALQMNVANAFPEAAPGDGWRFTVINPTAGSVTLALSAGMTEVAAAVNTLVVATLTRVDYLLRKVSSSAWTITRIN